MATFSATFCSSTRPPSPTFRSSVFSSSANRIRNTTHLRQTSASSYRLSATCRNICGLSNCAFSNVDETICHAISTLSAIVDGAIWTLNAIVDEAIWTLNPIVDGLTVCASGNETNGIAFEATLSATNAIFCANESGTNGIFSETLNAICSAYDCGFCRANDVCDFLAALSRDRLNRRHWTSSKSCAFWAAGRRRPLVAGRRGETRNLLP